MNFLQDIPMKYFAVINGYINENEEAETLLEYIQTIDYSKISINELGKIDDLITDGINDVKLIELLEKNNDLVKLSV